MKRIKKILFLFIVIFALFIRVYRIDTLPPSLHYDEIDAGYQAMIFNQNHTDYYGNKFPTHFRSFGDYRTSLHIYTIALFQQLSISPDLSVRLPSAIFGTLSVIVLFLVTKSVIPSFLLAVSPWAIHYSRIGFEVSGMIFVILLGIYFWKKFLETNKLIFIFLAAFFFCLSPYFYSTAKVFLPFSAILIFIIWQKEIIRVGVKNLITFIVFCLLILSPLIIDTLSGHSGYRFSYISIFTQPHREQVVDSLRYQDILQNHQDQIGVKTPLFSYFFHNKYQLSAKRLIDNYVSSFSTDFLITKGDNNTRHGFGGHGLIYLIDYFLVSIGIFSIFIPKNKNKLSILFLGLLLISPIPYALTRDSDSPHATRLILMLPSIIYFSFLGIKYVQSLGKHIFYVSLLILYFLSFIGFGHYYYYHYPQDNALYWNTGMKEAVVASNSYPQKPLVFSDSHESFVSFFLFYKPYPLLSSSISDHLKEINNSSFSGQILDDKYYFGHVNWSNLSKIPVDAVFIVPKSEYENQYHPMFNKVQIISKKYINQEEFYLLTNNE